MFPKIRVQPPKMDGENNGKPYEQMGWFGGTPIFGNTHITNMLNKTQRRYIHNVESSYNNTNIHNDTVR